LSAPSTGSARARDRQTLCAAWLRSKRRRFQRSRQLNPSKRVQNRLKLLQRLPPRSRA